LTSAGVLNPKQTKLPLQQFRTDCLNLPYAQEFVPQLLAALAYEPPAEHAFAAQAFEQAQALEYWHRQRQQQWPPQAFETPQHQPTQQAPPPGPPVGAPGGPGDTAPPFGNTPFRLLPMPGPHNGSRTVGQPPPVPPGGMFLDTSAGQRGYNQHSGWVHPRDAPPNPGQQQWAASGGGVEQPAAPMLLADTAHGGDLRQQAAQIQIQPQTQQQQQNAQQQQPSQSVNGAHQRAAAAHAANLTGTGQTLKQVLLGTSSQTPPGR